MYDRLLVTVGARRATMRKRRYWPVPAPPKKTAMLRLTILLASAVAASPVAAQRSDIMPTKAPTHPDFSGTWIMDVSSLNAQTASMVSPSTLLITQVGSLLTLRTTSTTSTEEQSETVPYQLDAVRTDTLMQAGVATERTFSASWDGSVLVADLRLVSRGKTVRVVASTRSTPAVRC